jgi:hypothetical protein
VAAVAFVEIDLEPRPGIKLGIADHRGQCALLLPNACPAETAAGRGRPAEGPIQTFFEFLYAVRHRGVVLPPRVTTVWLIQNRFAVNNAGRLLHTLYTLGLLDLAGQPVVELWHLNQYDPVALYHRLLEQGYPGLMEELAARPTWNTVRTWMRMRSATSPQMTQRQFGFFRHFLLAIRKELLVWEEVKLAAQHFDWNELLPAPTGRPKFIVLGPEPLREELLREGLLHEASPSVRPIAMPDPQLSIHFPPMLEVVEGGQAVTGG